MRSKKQIGRKYQAMAQEKLGIKEEDLVGFYEEDSKIIIKKME